MSRFEKKCFIGSATFHGLLLVVFLFGSAFFNSPPKDMGPVIDFFPGGAPASGEPPPAPAPPAPQIEQPQPTKVEPVKEVEPEPPKPREVKRETPKETEKIKGQLPIPVKAEKKDTAKDLTRPKSLVNTTVIRRSNVVDKAAIQLAQAQREKIAREAREAQARRNQAISDINIIISGVNNGVSRSSVVSSIGTDSSGGVASGRYGDGLKAIYDSKWILNADAYDDETAASVKVRVRRDGSVVSAIVTKPSGNAAFDRSVRAALNAVQTVLPFPSEMKDTEREFTWKFERKTRVG
jgi:colicin import membrane protein